jgi:hypothetical protein
VLKRGLNIDYRAAKHSKTILLLASKAKVKLSHLLSLRNAPHPFYAKQINVISVRIQQQQQQ